ncbi:MAG TPA: hypothetical protein VL574_15065 [Stellaceae bacterium]|jgi:hypothetical protein|nr:hypothetical protein [Stellaceae bacterium]
MIRNLFRSLAPSCLFMVLAFSLGVLAPGAAHAALIGDASIPYKAERTVVEDGRTYVGTMYSAPGMQRHDQTINNIRMTVILRADRGVMELWLPDFNVYTDLPLSDTLTRYGDRRLLPPPSGREMEDGVSTRKYRIRHRDQSGAEADGWLWLDDNGIARRLSGDYTTPGGRVTHVTAILSHVRPGPQPASLFVVPQGVQMLPPQAVAPILGLQLR